MPPRSRRIAPFEPTVFASLAGDTHPEFYPRPDGTLYICHATPESEAPLPSSPKDVTINSKACDDIEGYARTMLAGPWTEGTQVEKRQACYLPVNTETGNLLLGFLPGCRGVIAACGHSVGFERPSAMRRRAQG